MSETFCSSNGSGKTRRDRPGVQIRLFSLVLAIFVTTILMLLGVSRATWQRVNILQRELTSLKADNFYFGNFYFGVRVQSKMNNLNDTLLRYCRDGNERDHKQFQEESAELGRWLDRYSTNSMTASEQRSVATIRAAYDEYLAGAEAIVEMEPNFGEDRKAMFGRMYKQLQPQSAELLSLCGNFIEDQRKSFNQFVDKSIGTLQTFQNVLLLSVGLVVVLALMLLMLMYRGMIAPLRRQLIESRATIARQEKLASLGSLAAGVAHEIRNPLTAIRFRLFSLERAIPGSDSSGEDLTLIAGELDRLERIVDDFLRFARPSEPELVSVPAQRLLREVVDLLKPQLAKNRIELQLEESDPLWVRADTQQIKQVMINLIQNAADSIKQDGSITLRVRPERAPSSRRNGLAALEVSDTGNGIEPKLEERLFDPFFTTKEGGTGLGLPIAARIVEKHGGLIRYQTNSNGGATFTVVLRHVDEHEASHSADRR